MPPCRSGASRRTKSPSVSGSPRLHSLFVNWGKQRRQNWQCLRSCLDKQISSQYVWSGGENGLNFDLNPSRQVWIGGD